MNDFSFNDSIEENGYDNGSNEKNKIIKFVIIAVVSLVVGLSVYFVTDALINGGKKNTVVNEVKDSEMDLSDEMITYLYDNVTYEVNGVRNDKFFKSGSVTVDDFTNEEKFYYALRYATEADFIDMSTTSVTESEGEEETTEEVKLKTFSISNDRIKEYMFNFFGENVTYSTDSPINIAVNFQKDGYNAGVLKYDSTNDSFLVTFDSVSKSGNEMPINPYLYKIESAVRKGENNNIIIKEKIVFTKCTQYTDEAGEKIDKYDCGIYSDFAMNSSLELKNGVTESELTVLGIENYKDSAATVTYTFSKDSNDEYHFLSSEISNN